MRVTALQRYLSVIFLLPGLLCSCTRHDNAKAALARLRNKAEVNERILARDPTNYHAIHDLALTYGSIYTLDTFTGSGSTSGYKEKALSLTREALKKAPVMDQADLGMNLERLGSEQEALSAYEKFLKEAEQTPPPIANLASNVPPSLNKETVAEWNREAFAEWRGLVAMVQTRADLLRKSLAGQPQTHAPS